MCLSSVSSNRIFFLKVISIVLGICFLVISPAFISSNQQAINQKKIEVERVKTISGLDLGKLLKTDIKKKFNESYSGQYEYYVEDKQRVLHGKFYFYHADSSGSYQAQNPDSDELPVRLIKINYAGHFRENKKEGKFVEELFFDDSIDLYSKWTITIDYKEDQCTSALFEGAIGHVMPADTKYSFQNLDTCSFDRVMTLAEKNWAQEYEKQNTGR